MDLATLSERNKFFEREADELLVETIIHETKMEKRKQQQQLQPTIAIIETYRYFQMLQILLTDRNMRLFYAKRDEHFENLLMVFLLKIKNEQRIDFTINR